MPSAKKILLTATKILFGGVLIKDYCAEAAFVRVK
jgi:hypothetical protein